MNNPFTKHPKNIGETYLRHAMKAVSYSVRLFVMSFQVGVHSVFPFLFTHTVSDKVKLLNDELLHRRGVK